MYNLRNKTTGRTRPTTDVAVNGGAGTSVKASAAIRTIGRGKLIGGRRNGVGGAGRATGRPLNKKQVVVTSSSDDDSSSSDDDSSTSGDYGSSSDDDSSSSSSSQEEITYYMCRLCPGSKFTAGERDEHRLVHSKKLLKKFNANRSKSDKRKQQQNTQEAKLEIQLPNESGKLAISISVEHIPPTENLACGTVGKWKKRGLKRMKLSSAPMIKSSAPPNLQNLADGSKATNGCREDNAAKKREQE